MKKIVKYIFSLSLVLLINVSMAQSWKVPADEAKKENSVEYNLKNVKKGKELYNVNCKSCHGDVGKNNALPLQPPPPDVASDKMQKNTEGELYYKITYGKGGMPQFETTLSEDDRWKIVAFIENYNPERKQLLSNAPAVPAKIKADIDKAKKMVNIGATYLAKNNEYLPIANKPLTVFKKTYFGKYKLGEVNTDANGKASLQLDENIIGDEEGNLNLLVELGEEYKADEVLLKGEKMGQKKESTSLIEKNVLWSTNENTSLWLVLSYAIGVLLVWSIIFYVIFQIIKIAALSKK